MTKKSVNGLMKHLRENGVNINGSRQKEHLEQYGYFHGYKGYRFFKKSHNKIPITDYREIMAIIEYDNELKRLLYSELMFIETSVKNIALEVIIQETKNGTVSELFELIEGDYTEVNTIKRQQTIQNKLNEITTIQRIIADEYSKGNPMIVHYLETRPSNELPIWALFENLTMGQFAHILATLKFDVRGKIERKLGFNISIDPKREMLYKSIFILKNLRNSIAHNSIIFDNRYLKSPVSKEVNLYIKREMSLRIINFNNFESSIILIILFLKKLKKSKIKINNLINSYEKTVFVLKNSVSNEVYNTIISKNYDEQLYYLKKSIRKNK